MTAGRVGLAWLLWVVAHASLAWLGLHWTYEDSNASIIAPAAGIGAVAVLMLRRQLITWSAWRACLVAWSVVPVGAGIAAALMGRSGWLMTAYVTAFALEAVIAGEARFASVPKSRTATPMDVLGLALLGLVAPIVPAGFIAVGAQLEGLSLPVVEGLRWWVSHGLGMAAVAPVLLTLRRDLWTTVREVSWGERAAAILALAGAAIAIIFDGEGVSVALAMFVAYWWAVRMGVGPAAWAGAIIAAALAIAVATTGGPFRGTLELITTQLFAHAFVFMTMVAAVFSEARRRAVAEARESAHRLEHVLNHDPVTGLPVRTVLYRELSQRSLTRPNQALAVAVVDVDSFHRVNEEFGRAGGDVVLRTVARRLTVAAGRERLAHLSGDQFCVAVIGDVDHRRIDAISALLLDAVSTPIPINGRTAQITASIGVAVGTMTEFGRLLRDADDAVMQAKGQGRNRWVVLTQDQRAQMAIRQTLIDDLPDGVTRGELFCLFQLISPVDSAIGVGAEALVRWQHPHLGLLGPREFLSTLIDAGRIPVLGDFMLRTALAQWKAWQASPHDRHRPSWVSVNISAVELDDPLLAERVMAALEEAGAPGSALVLEVTEDCLIELSDQTRNHIDRLRAHGVRLSIDDFGTGYSSLAYLTHLPIDILKLDGTFVRATATDRDLRLMRAVCSLGREIGMVTVIEGVETSDHVETAIAAGADAVQGYFIGRPSSAAALPGPIDLRTLREHRVGGVAGPAGRGV